MFKPMKMRYFSPRENEMIHIVSLRYLSGILYLILLGTTILLIRLTDTLYTCNDIVIKHNYIYFTVYIKCLLFTQCFLKLVFGIYFEISCLI